MDRKNILEILEAKVNKTFLVFVEGKEGINPWYKEITVTACNIRKALQKAEQVIREQDATITYIKQMG